MTEDIHSERATAKAKRAVAPVSKSDTAWIDQLGLNEDQGGLLVDVTGKLQVLNRKSTEHAFDIAHQFQRAKSILPAKSFGKWLKPVAGYTVKAANLYISVHEQLGDYKERLISAAVPPTTMFIMARGSHTGIETAIKAFENGERLTGRQVQAIIDADNGIVKSEETPIPLNVPGLAGLKKAAAAKQIEEISLFRAMIASIRQEVEEALKPLERRRPVVKKHLADKIALDCRHAHDLLCSIAVPVTPGLFPYNNWTHGTFDKGTDWYKVQMLLFRAGSAEAWPDRSDFVEWLLYEMLPGFKFILDDEPLPELRLSKMPGAVKLSDYTEANDAEAETTERIDIEDMPSIDFADIPEMPGWATGDERANFEEAIEPA
jgi:hypothetical protein